MRLFRYVVPCAVLAALGCSGGEEIGAVSTNSTSCGDDASGGGGGLALDASVVDATATAEAATDSASGAEAQSDASGAVATMEAGAAIPAVVDAGSSGTTLYALGTGLGSGNVGPDGMIEQALGANGLFAQIAVPRSNGYMAGATWEPISQQFYEFGNTDGSNPAQSYSPATNAWTNLYNIPASGGQGCVGTVNGILSIVGGFNDKAKAISSVIAYDPVKQAYTTKASLATPVGDCFAVTLGSFIYHGGGASNNEGPGTKATTSSSWFQYNPATDTRLALASLPFSIAQSATAYLNGKIYVVGGFTGPAGETVGTSGVLEYNVAANTWAQKKNFPVAVSGACAAPWNGTIYVIGGFTSAGFPNATKSIYVYNQAADSWSLAPYSLTQATEVSACGPAPYPKGFN
jgi:N-acetylneuraminic acid mutarotase